MSAAHPEVIKLGNRAIYALLNQQSIAIDHPDGWKRDGFPLPIKKALPDAAGITRLEYRPMAILEYIQEVLSGEMAARRMRDKKATEKS